MMEKNKKKAEIRMWFEFLCSVYPVRVLLCIGSRKDMLNSMESAMRGMNSFNADGEVNAFVKEFRAKFNETTDEICGECVSAHTKFGRMWIVRVDSFGGSFGDVATLSHECLHAALAIHGHCGVVERAPYEALCYLHEAIFKRFLMAVCGRKRQRVS